MAKDKSIGDTAERFNGRLPEILPELQWPDELTQKMGKEVVRRFELTNRAYSAAVYAHEDRFAPRSESLLTGGPTKKLLRSEKEQLLTLFERECFAVLGSVREFLWPMRPVPPGQRIVLLNDYQAWVKQVKELLREAVFAEESEVWNQDLLHLFQSHKPNEPFPQKAFRQLVDKPVFFELEYLTKFRALFLAQMELDQRLGLMSDIVLDLIRAYETRMRDRENKVMSEAYIPFTTAIELSNGVLTRKKLEKAIDKSDPVKVRDRKPSKQRREVHIQDVLALIKKLEVDDQITDTAIGLFSRWKAEFQKKQPRQNLD